MIDYQIPKAAGLAGLRLWRDSRFDLGNSENEANLLVLPWQLSQFGLCSQAQDSFSCISTRNLVFSWMNLKPALLKNFVFDWALCFGLCEVYRFQNLVGLELPIKHPPSLSFSELVPIKLKMMASIKSEGVTSSNF